MAARPPRRTAPGASAGAAPPAVAPRAVERALRRHFGTAAAFVAPRPAAVGLAGRSSVAPRRPRCGAAAAGAARRDGGAFLFCASGARVQLMRPREAARGTHRSAVVATNERLVACSSGMEEGEARHRRRHPGPAGPLRLPEPEIGHAALLLPSLAAAAGAGGSGAVVASCLPLIVPFSMPQLSPLAWFSNKRALAYNRCVIVSVYAQGAFAVLKFASGNVVGGFFDGCQAAMGVYSLMPEGMRMFPTFMMMSGFNGIVGLLQVLQQYNGVPLHWLPPLQVFPPVVSIVSAYFCWQFLSVCRDIAAEGGQVLSYQDGQQQETCLVRAMAGDWWPAFLSSSIYGESVSPGQARRDREAEAAWGTFGGGSLGGGRRGFSVFEGGGHRLGEA